MKRVLENILLVEIVVRHVKAKVIIYLSTPLPIVSKIHPTVPSPPQHTTLKFGTSLNIVSPCIGPPVARLCTCLGFSMYWNFLSILVPCLPPDLGLIKTRTGTELAKGVIWKDIGGCLFPELKELWKYTRNCWRTGQRWRWFTELLSCPCLEPLFCNDLCLSKTIGQIVVGGSIWVANSPSPHSAFTWATHLLCS